jgi:hypothetical protein
MRGAAKLPLDSDPSPEREIAGRAKRAGRSLLRASVWLACLTIFGAFVAACTPTPAELSIPPEDPSPPDEPVGPDEDFGTLAFDDDEPLVVAPGERRVVKVTVSPARQTTVRFALLDDPGTASLDASFANTNEAGEASVGLVASNQATRFRLRANVGTSTAAREVQVEGVGLAQVQVKPSYAGKRTITAWTLSAKANTSCSSLSSSLVDGPLSVTVPTSEIPLLSNVPVGPSIAVLLRGGGLVSGCADVTNLFVGERREVSLSVVDVPLSLAQSRLHLTLSVAPEPVGWSPLLTRWSARYRGAFLGGQEKAASALLDAMSLRVTTETSVGFQQKRAAAGWDAALATAYAASGPDLLVDQWLPSAVSVLREAPGPVDGILRAGATPTAAPLFQPSEVLRLVPTDGDKVGLFDITWKVDASDVLSAGGSITFAPTRMVGRALTEVVKAEVPGAVDGPAGLIAVARCEDVAAMLTSSSQALAACDVGCATSLCESALRDMWERSTRTDELAGNSAKLTFGATGPTSSDEQARVTGFSGTWVGSVADSAAKEGDTPAQLKGAASAVTDP